jgi:hypothetical protein
VKGCVGEGGRGSLRREGEGVGEERGGAGVLLRELPPHVLLAGGQLTIYSWVRVTGGQVEEGLSELGTGGGGQHCLVLSFWGFRS